MSALRTEDELRAALEHLAADAPTIAEVLPDTGARLSRPRHRIRHFAPLAVVVLVVALAVGLAAPWRSGRHSSGGDLQRLVAIDWRLSTVAGQPIGQALVLIIKPNGRFAQGLAGCTSLDGRLGLGAQSLTIEDVQLSIGVCPALRGEPAVDIRAEHALRRMFKGTLSWSIAGDRLTLRKQGTPTLVYTRAPQWPAQTRQWTFHRVGISLPADWPANAVRCGTPIADTVVLPSTGPIPSCSHARPAGVTSVEFSDYGTHHDGPMHFFGSPARFLIDGVQGIERSTAPGSLQVIELDIPSHNTTITITSPNRSEAFRLESGVYIASH